MPQLDPTRWRDYPPAIHRLTGQSNGPYSEVVLGEQAGLSQFGVHMERLPPGSRSSLRHWHEAEDEFVYVLQGEVVLVEDAETTLRAGDCAAWKAGSPVGHCLENRSASMVQLLVVGTRAAQDRVHFADHALVLDRDGAVRRFLRPDGTPVAEDPGAAP